MKAYELLAKSENWIQHAGARTKEGAVCNVHDSRAVAFCLVGAIMKCYGPTMMCDQVRKIRETTEGFSAFGWNDDPKRTHEEVLNTLKQLDI